MDYNKDPKILSYKTVLILLAIGFCALTILTLITFIFVPELAGGAEKLRMDANSYDSVFNPSGYTSLNDPGLLADLQEASINLRETTERLKEEEESKDSYGCFISSIVGGT